MERVPYWETVGHFTFGLFMCLLFVAYIVAIILCFCPLGRQPERPALGWTLVGLGVAAFIFLLPLALYTTS